MSLFILLMQIGELFDGNFNWRGVFHLFLFVLMALIIIGFSAFAGYKAFRPNKKSNNDGV